MPRMVICIVEVAGLAAAKALAFEHGDGPDTFSAAFSTSPTETNRNNATHFAMEGQIPEEEVAAFEASVDPVIEVMDAETARPCAVVMAARTSPLYPVQEPV